MDRSVTRQEILLYRENANRLSNNEKFALNKWYSTLDTFSIGTLPRGFAYDGYNIWVLDSTEERVYLLDPSTGEPNGVTMSVGTNPQNIAYDGTYMWVTNSGDNTVTRIDARNHSLTSFNTGSSPSGIVYDGTYVWVMSSTLHRFNQDGTQTAGPFTLASNCLRGAFDGTNLWVILGTNAIQRVDQSGAIVGGTILDPTLPGEMIFDGVYIWVTDIPSNALYKYDTSGAVVGGPFSVGFLPNPITYDGTSIYVCDLSNVHRINRDTGAIEKSFTSSFCNNIIYDGKYLWTATTPIRRISV